jgi:hypothetical protein
LDFFHAAPAVSTPRLLAAFIALIAWCTVAARAADAPASPATRLEAAQNALALAAVNLSAIPPAEAAGYGGHLEAARARLRAALATIESAGAAQPDANRAAPPADTAPALVVPPMPQVAPFAPRTPLVEAVAALNDALAALVGDAARAGSGQAAAPGVPPALAAKILADLGAAGAELSAGVEFLNAPPAARPAAPDPTVRPPDALASIVASIALTLALSLGGLHFFTRRPT